MNKHDLDDAVESIVTFALTVLFAGLFTAILFGFFDK